MADYNMIRAYGSQWRHLKKSQLSLTLFETCPILKVKNTAIDPAFFLAISLMNWLLYLAFHSSVGYSPATAGRILDIQIIESVKNGYPANDYFQTITRVPAVIKPPASMVLKLNCSPRITKDKIRVSTMLHLSICATFDTSPIEIAL